MSKKHRALPTTSRRLVIALGGNALSGLGEEGTIEQQFLHTAETAQLLCDVIERGYQPIITHGNGPQVGNVLRRVELASDELYPIPLEVCVADTQAGMGYMIAQCLCNALAERGRECDVTTLVTTVLVDRHDPAFSEPTKPIGTWLTAEQAESHRVNDGWCVRQFAGEHYRRIVPSPRPQEILELTAVRQLVEAGQIVITCGGGGIPVWQDSANKYHGAAAVIDKDHTSTLLALELCVPTLLFLTSVDHVYLNFGTLKQQALDTLPVDDARRYLAEDQFATGSMRPKIETAIDFVEQSPHKDAVAIIAHLNRVTEALDGTSGTRIMLEAIKES